MNIHEISDDPEMYKLSVMDNEDDVILFMDFQVITVDGIRKEERNRFEITKKELQKLNNLVALNDMIKSGEAEQ